MLRLVDVTANAFIELDKRDLPMEVSNKQLYNYAYAIGKTSKYPVDFSGAAILNMELNYNKFIVFNKKENTITPVHNITSHDLVKKFRSNITAGEYSAYTSDAALKTIGIGPNNIGRTK